MRVPDLRRRCEEDSPLPKCVLRSALSTLSSSRRTCLVQVTMLSGWALPPVLPAHRERGQVAVGDWSVGREKTDASQNLACAAEMVPRVFARSSKRPLALGIAMLVVAAVPICGDDGGIEVCIAPICSVAPPSLAEIRRHSPVKQGAGQDSLAPLQR